MTNTERIDKIKETVLTGIPPQKKESQLSSWLSFLEKELKFPFQATIQDSECFELQWKDVVKVNKIEVFEDMYGVLLEIKKGRRKYYFPLCDLEIIDKKSKNRFIIEAFLEWWTDEYV